MVEFTNRLINETSPYLLQHAHNPVNWYPWDEEALKKAKQENKPILISIGYAACHWCHVMEKESFEDKETADLMNSDFINIKVDREERPDLDHIYMDAVQAITGSGGWPLNVFLTPDARPFYGGTYFPPVSFQNKPSWKDVLISISGMFKNSAEQIEAQAKNLTGYLIESNSFFIKSGHKLYHSDSLFDKRNLDYIYDNIMKLADKQDGGFGRAPKFPQTSTIQFLLYHYYYTQHSEALDQACLSLDKMINGGIYDHVSGGFARYSTDNEWLVPHFEKMLYDNALLITVLSESYQLTKKNQYKKTIEHTIDFIKLSLTSHEGGFYTSLDADSEGEEGKYYVWDKKEINQILGEDSELFSKYYNVTEKGNWESKNILHCNLSVLEFAGQNNIEEQYLVQKLEKCRQKLFQVRSKRISPRLDNKIILGWNALMIIALCKAYAALGIDEYKRLAVANMNFLLKRFKGEQEHLFMHCYTNGMAKYPAFLDDYSFLISSLIQLQEITAESSYLLKAREIALYVINNFSSLETGLFFYTHKDQNDVIIRKKEIYDGATPSGNSIMAFNLIFLSKIFNIPEWNEIAVNICCNLNKSIISYPTSFAVWATLLQCLTYNFPEIVITGKQTEGILKDFFETFIPFKVFQSTTCENEQFPLLVKKVVSENAKIYICKNYSCQEPVMEISKMKEKLKELGEN
ncbi:MAG TPA: thioredoxin domain-containing protein [Puia sp.]|nr:thioredoxin domain-containing protein [Puia sp.]